jgi:hypothetical protein
VKTPRENYKIPDLSLASQNQNDRLNGSKKSEIRRVLPFILSVDSGVPSFLNEGVEKLKKFIFQISHNGLVYEKQ